jgi:hypothetical protein
MFGRINKSIHFLKKFKTRHQSKALYVPANIYNDDVWIVSYPKSGNTWLRFLIGNYLTKGKCDWTNIDLVVPDIHYNPDHCDNIGRPRFIKSHSKTNPYYRNVVYLVRDGRDVAISYYFHCLKYGIIKPNVEFSDFLVRFNKGHLPSYGIWNNHVNGWLDKHPETFLLISYEKMLKKPEDVLKQILSVAGINFEKKRVIEAVKNSSFQSMQMLEERQKHKLEHLGGVDLTIPFVRSGGNSQKELFFNKKFEKKFLRYHKRAMQRLGYLID